MDNIEIFMKGDNFKSPSEIKMLNPLVMAFVGDSVYSTYVKSRVLSLSGKRVNNLTKETAMIINASAQEQAIFKLMEHLTEEETDIVRRARNTNIHTKAKNYSIEEYRYATAFEALIGYLYLSKQTERLNLLLKIVFEGKK